MATAPSSSDEAAQVSSSLSLLSCGQRVLYKPSLCSSSMTQYLIIHERSLYNHPPAGLLLYLGHGFWYREKGIMSFKSY